LTKSAFALQTKISCFPIAGGARMLEKGFGFLKELDFGILGKFSVSYLHWWFFLNPEAFLKTHFFDIWVSLLFGTVKRP